MEVDGMHLAVVGSGMVFCEVIQFVVFAGLPINLELPLSNAVADPAKAQVNGFGLFLFVIDDSLCTSVVCLDGCCWLGGG